MWQPYVPTHVVDLHCGNQWYIQNFNKCSYIYAPWKGKLFTQSRRQVCCTHLFLGGACPAVHVRVSEARGQMLTTTFSLQFHLLFPFIFLFYSYSFCYFIWPATWIHFVLQNISFICVSFIFFHSIKNYIFTVCNYIAVFQPFY